MTNGSFGDLLRQIIARKHGLTQTRLAHLIGYDQAVLTRMMQGKKDLTGLSGRERVVQIIGVLRDEGVLTTQTEANALLKAGAMAPLYDGQPVEAALLDTLKPEAAPTPVTHPFESTSPPGTNLPLHNLPQQPVLETDRRDKEKGHGLLNDPGAVTIYFW